MMFDTNKLVMPLIIIGIVVLSLMGGLFVYSAGFASGYKTSPVPAVVTPAPVQTQIIPNYPSVLTFTVLSSTSSTGRYQVLTTAGNILYFNDYYLWNSMQLQATYTATITGYDGIAYYVGTANLIRSPYYYPYRPYPYGRDRHRHYYWHDRYYECNQYTCDLTNANNVVGEEITYEEPPFGVGGKAY